MGVSIKNLGNYLKSSITRNSADALKTFNSLNIKPTSNYKLNQTNSSANSTQINETTMNSQTAVKARQSASLTHRHSNPGSSYSNASTNPSSFKSRMNGNYQQSAASTIANDASALPRIRINS